MTKQEAIEKAESGWWKQCSQVQVALWQLAEPRLCMPFSDFHAAVEEACGRPVWTHEFGLTPYRLIEEILAQFGITVWYCILGEED